MRYTTVFCFKKRLCGIWGRFSQTSLHASLLLLVIKCKVINTCYLVRLQRRLSQSNTSTRKLITRRAVATSSFLHRIISKPGSKFHQKSISRVTRIPSRGRPASPFVRAEATDKLWMKRVSAAKVWQASALCWKCSASVNWFLIKFVQATRRCQWPLGLSSWFIYCEANCFSCLLLRRASAWLVF